MTIRRARPTDFRRLTSIDQVTRTSQTRRAWLRQCIRERTVWVQKTGNGIQAYAILSRNFFQHPFIEQLFVAKEERRQGLGEGLLARMEKRGLRYGEIWTSTNQSNRPMQALLKKRGYIQCGCVTGLDPGDPELFFAKRRPVQPSKWKPPGTIVRVR